MKYYKINSDEIEDGDCDYTIWMLEGILEKRIYSTESSDFWDDDDDFAIWHDPRDTDTITIPEMLKGDGMTVEEITKDEAFLEMI